MYRAFMRHTLTSMLRVIQYAKDEEKENEASLFQIMN